MFDLSLRTRLMLLMGLLLLTASAAVMVGYPARMNRLTRQGFEERAMTLTALVAESVAPGVDFDDPDHLLRQFSHLETVPDAHYAAVRLEDGSLLAAWGAHDAAEHLDFPWSEPILHYGPTHLDCIFPIVTEAGSKATLHVAYSTEQLEHSHTANFHSAALLSGGLLVVGLALTWIIATVLVRSVRRVTRSAEAVASSDFDVSTLHMERERSWADSRDEGRRLTHAIAQIFDGVVEQVEELDQERRRAIMAEARALEAARTRTEFVANVSHELRTPLNAILGISELVADDSEHTDSAAVLEDVRRIHGAGLHLLALVDDVLDFSKLEAGRATLEQVEFAPRAVVLRTLDLVEETAHAKGIELGWTMEGPEAAVGDPHKLAQVLTNLVANAVKFTERGRVDLVVRTLFEDGNRFQLRFEVRDTGVGIDPSRAEALFDPFIQADGSTSRRYGGTGLGLAISRRLVRLMGGEIGVAPREGGGSTFWFTIDVLHANTPLPAKPARTCSEPDRTRRVLLVEDDELNRQVGTRQLRKLGCEVEVARDGQEALTLALSGEWDLVFMDCQMPVLDGYDATRAIRIRENDHHVPIVALTANASSEDRELCMNAGMDDYMTKPLNLERLRAMLDTWA